MNRSEINDRARAAIAEYDALHQQYMAVMRAGKELAELVESGQETTRHARYIARLFSAANPVGVIFSGSGAGFAFSEWVE